MNSEYFDLGLLGLWYNTIMIAACEPVFPTEFLIRNSLNTQFMLIIAKTLHETLVLLTLSSALQSLAYERGHHDFLALVLRSPLYSPRGIHMSRYSLRSLDVPMTHR